MMSASYTHHPVLLSEVIEGLEINPSGIYVDGTFGRGGHARAILEKLNNTGKLIGIDKDFDAIKDAQNIKDKRFKIYQGSFKNIKNFISEKVNGILLDLGVSSPQFDDATRGFSFQKSGPLDMRMDTTQGMTASEWLKKIKEENLYDIIKTYGEERFAGRITKAIIAARKIKTIETTKELADIVAKAHPAWEKDKHPATRTFQALRIYINEELDDLKKAIPDCIELLKPKGRLCVICFHSLEGRIVKDIFREKIKNKIIKYIGKKIMPTDEEIKHNPRARSAVLRIVEKI